MQTAIFKDDRSTVIALSGRLDSNTAPQLEKQLAEIITSPTSHLAFDLSELEYIASAGLRVILNTANAYKAGPFRFVTCAAQDHILEVFEISGFDTIITIQKSVAEFRAGLAG